MTCTEDYSEKALNIRDGTKMIAVRMCENGLLQHQNGIEHIALQFFQ